MRTLYLIIPILLLCSVAISSEAFGEVEIGPDYDRTKIDENTYIWTSKPERLEDWPNHFVDYKFYDKPDYLSYESKYLSANINKSTCSLRLFDYGLIESGESPKIIISHTVKSAPNGTDIWSTHEINEKDCSFDVDQSEGLVITSTKDSTILGVGTKFDVVYDYDHSGFLKWSYKMLNADPVNPDTKYGFTTVFDGDIKIEIGGLVYDTEYVQDTISITANQLANKPIRIFDDNSFEVVFDPQNYIHNYLWMVKIQNKKVIFDFTYSKGAIPFGQTLEVDPVFGYTSSGNSNPAYYYDGTSGTNCADSTSGTAKTFSTRNVYVGLTLSGDTNGCTVTVPRWDISAIPAGATVTNVNVRYDIQTVNSASFNCDWNEINTDPVSGTNAQMYADANNIGGGTNFVSGDTLCKSTGNNKVVDLGSSADTDLTAQIPSGWWAAGFAPTSSATRDASNHSYESLNTGTYLIELEVTYTLPPTSIDIKPMRYDNSTLIGVGTVLKQNATKSETMIINSTGWARSTDVSVETNYNYTVKDATDNFVVNKTINKSISSPQSKQGRTNIFDVNCDGDVDNDWQVKGNASNYHNLTFWQTPSVNAECDISGLMRFIKSGIGPATNQTTKIIARSLDTTNYNWCPSKVLVNGTEATYNCNTGLIVFNGTNIQVANGYSTVRLAFTIFTDNRTSLPTGLTATPVSETRINLSWAAPAQNHGDEPYSYLIYRDGAVLVNSTGTMATTYSDTAAGPGGTAHTYQVCAWNRIGCSPYSSSVSATTYTTTTGTISLNQGNVGDVTNINATLTITAGSPTPFTISNTYLYRNNTLVYTNTTDFTISSVGGTYLQKIWYQITNDMLNVFRVQFQVSNSTGTVTIVSSTTNVTREYDPEYETALDPTQGLVNATTSRSDDQDTVYIKLNRDKGGAIFNVECLLQNNFEAAFTNNTGTWINRTNVGFYNASISGFDDSPLYGICYNDGELLTFVSYSNSSLSLFGIAAFDNTYGSFIGVPVGVLFVAMSASMASQRTAPTWIIVILGMIGVMSTVGFFTVDANVWALALVAGMLGIFVGRKFF